MHIPGNSSRHTINFIGVHVDVLNMQGLYKKVIEFAQDNKPRKVMYVNAHCMVISRNDEEYRNILNAADLVYADGMSLVWGAKLSGHYLPGRSTAADFMPMFCKLFAREGLRLYLLGAELGVAETAGSKLKQKSPALEIVGTHHGYFNQEEDERIIAEINKSRPHILLVGMGVPYQEKWIHAHYGSIDVPVIWGVGALFDFLSGKLARGPQLLLNHGFEWLCRLFVEPRRLGKRYLVGNLLFMAYVFQWKLFRPRSKARK
ncbi:MAG: WecB/TagA/CpsF family glycosyltransferase [Desulfobacteraceae bacterium]|nr:WecB/TagA/CpsF family glycosyltransferase [Desulfobacteraceae bacterium]MBC2718652.1 WecB/TagA/CpsF family glycosyltransferase [Desulfobacteraceae bacterium]